MMPTGMENSKIQAFFTTLLLVTLTRRTFLILFFDIGGAISKFVEYYNACLTLSLEEVTRGRQERTGSVRLTLSLEEVTQGCRNEQEAYAYIRLIL